MKLHLTAGLVTAAYVATALYFVAAERARPSGGGWNNLQGIVSFILTAPTSYLRVRLGGTFDFRSNTQIALGIVTCALLLYGGVFCAGKLARFLFSSGS